MQRFFFSWRDIDNHKHVFCQGIKYMFQDQYACVIIRHEA